MITRAIFVLTSEEAGEQFLKILPDLRALGLAEATILHLISAAPGPAEPMPELANWVRHFEATIPSVELALKRGDPVKWIYELARVRDVDIVVISGIPNGTDWDFERVSSPLRNLRVPILFLPDEVIEAAIGERVLVAIKSPETVVPALAGLQDWFQADRLKAIRVAPATGASECRDCAGIALEIVPPIGDVATTLLTEAEQRAATLLTILAENEAPAGNRKGIPVVKPLIETTGLPILIWPADI